MKRKRPARRSTKNIGGDLGGTSSGASQVVAGFPEFWQLAHDSQKECFAALEDLAPLVNEALGKPYPSEQLHR